MAQRRFDDQAPPPSREGEIRAAIGMGWLAQLKLRSAVANDNRVPPWPAAVGTLVLIALAALLLYAGMGALG